MPQLEVKTISANEVWSKGEVTIWELELEYQGKPVSAKTYSKAIATPGWSGTVETYEKTNNRGGSDTFVKQPQKEGGYSGGGGYRGGGGKKDADPFTMYLSYAKDLAVALIGQGVMPSTKKFETEYAAGLGNIEAGGAQLFTGREKAKAGEVDKPQAVAPTSDEESQDISVEDLSSVLDGGEQVDPGETPWPPTS